MNILIPQTRVLDHFTAGRFIDPIKREGLTKGVLPWHRCRRTGEALVIRAWAEQNMTARGVHNMRASERKFESMAKSGNVSAAQEWKRLFPGFQWLTTSPDWHQPFAFMGELPFSKNAHRVTVCVPAERSMGLHRWRDLCARHKPPAAEEINTPAVDWENWFVFNGWIPTEWFLEVARNPGQTIAAGLIEGGNG